MRAEHLEELKQQIRESGSKIALDLEEVNLVDVDVIRFRCAGGVCRRSGVLVHYGGKSYRGWRNECLNRRTYSSPRA